MDSTPYHLAAQGKIVGQFSLAELQRRRAAGELGGAELVWREGMASWQPLDAFLQQAPAVRAGAHPYRAVFWVLGICLALGIVAIGAVVLVVRKSTGPWLNTVSQVRSQAGVEWAAREVVVPTNSLTVAQVLKRRRAFRLRQYLEAYREHGQRDAACDAEALQLISAWIEQNYGTNVPPPSLPELGEKLATNAACVDPLVITVTAVNADSPAERTRRLERALRGFEHSGYKAYPKFYATVSLAKELSAQPARLAELDALAIQRFKELLADGSLLPTDQEEMAEILVNDWGASFFKRQSALLLPVAGKAGQTFEWLALVLDGEHHVEQAWRARGRGWGDTVTKEGWAGFARHLADARVSLTKAWQLRPDSALAPARMITVAMGTSDAEEMRLWFDRAVSAQFDYPSAWAKLRWGLRPRWGGSMAAIQALGTTALNTKRFDTDIPRQFFDAIRDIESDLEVPASQRLFGREDIWPLLQRMYTGYIAEPTQASCRDGWRSTFAAVAFLARHYEVAREQLEPIQWQPWPKNLSGWGVDLSLLPLEVAARTSPWSNDVASAEAAYSRGDLAKALALHSKLSRTPNLDQRTKDFVRSRLAVLQFEQQWAKGGWIELLPKNDNDPAWVVLSGKTKSLPDGALEVESGPYGHLLYCRPRLGTNFVAKIEYDVVRASNQAAQAGLIMGLPEYEAWDWYILQLKGNPAGDGFASYTQGWAEPRWTRQAPLSPGHNTLTVKFRGGHAMLLVNSRPVLNDAPPPASLYVPGPDFRLGLGATADAGGTLIRYRHFRVRKLPLDADWRTFGE